MRTICICILVLFCNCIHAQSTKEINQQVWLPFMETFSSGNNEGFSSVHSKEVIRVEQDSKRIFGYDQYFKKQPDSIRLRNAIWKKNIELRFLQRIDGADKAFEIGYYKTSSKNIVTGESRVSYGKFHVLLRKENGAWKILMDADAYENVNEKVFLTGEIIQN